MGTCFTESAFRIGWVARVVVRFVAAYTNDTLIFGGPICFGCSLILNARSNRIKQPRNVRQTVHFGMIAKMLKNVASGNFEVPVDEGKGWICPKSRIFLSWTAYQLDYYRLSLSRNKIADGKEMHHDSSMHSTCSSIWTAYVPLRNDHRFRG